MNGSIGFNSKDAPASKYLKSTDEKSEINVAHIPSDWPEICKHKVVDEDASLIINKIVDIAKEILLITKHKLPVERE